MDLPTGFAADIHRISVGLDPDGTGIEESLSSFARSLIVAVPSFTGLTVHLNTPEGPIIVDVMMVTAVESTASLQLLHSALSTISTPDELILYASRPGSFVDLAADLAHFLLLPLTAIVLDHNLPGPRRTSLIGAQECSTVNQAIGMLIAQGHTRGSAHRELQHAADRSHATLYMAARQLTG